MFENIGKFFKKMTKTEQKELGSKDAAKERLHLVLMQDRANVSADFLELMKQEIIDVIKKYIIIDESSIDVRLTNQSHEDGTSGAPALYANIPIVNIKNDMMTEKIKEFEVASANIKLDNVENNTSEETTENTVKEDIASEILEEKDNNEEEKNTINNDSDDEIVNVDNKDENTEDSSENEEDDDFDLTFDDLLKAAEEEENEQVQEVKPNNNKKKKKKSKR